MPPTPRDLAACDRLARLGRDHGLSLRGARVRRTSSRFCLGVEHGDYNGTELFGVGTDRFLWLAWAPNDRGTLRLCSANFAAAGVVEVDPARMSSPGDVRGWARYAHGAVAVLARDGIGVRRGLDIALYGDIPGGGMSRSASLCVNLLLTLLDANGATVPHPFRIVELARAIEHEWASSPCGVLDQTMILFAKAGHGTRFDPATATITHVPLGAAAVDFRLLALDTGTERPGLETSTYRARRAECDELVRLANARGFAIQNLADVRDRGLLAAIAARLGPGHAHLVDRLVYVHEAQARFPRMLAAWQAGELATVGAVFRADGIGLRDRYRISGPELETMCDLARGVDGCLGERMLGGGDKGASGAIVRADAVDAVRAAVATGYPRSHPEFAERFAVHELALVDGVTVLDAILDG
jgi:galactokinase